MKAALLEVLFLVKALQLLADSSSCRSDAKDSSHCVSDDIEVPEGAVGEDTSMKVSLLQARQRQRNEAATAVVEAAAARKYNRTYVEAAAAARKYNSTGPVYQFYVYRGQSDKNYPIENVNVASIAGVMWYLANEIVPDNCMRRFDITRIIRLKLTYRPTPEIIAKGSHFGVRYAFDSGQCTGPEACKKTWDQYGYVVGCNKFEQKYPYPDFETFYNDGIWYSLPGKCSEFKYHDKPAGREKEDPGGVCANPNGTRHCTWSVEPAGEINLDELVGIKGSHADWCNRGCYEYKRGTKRGRCTSFWDKKWSRRDNARRAKDALDLFAQKYPNGEKLVPATCDFDMDKLYHPRLTKKMNHAYSWSAAGRSPSPRKPHHQPSPMPPTPAPTCKSIGKCGKYIRGSSCQCTAKCEKYGNCCSDYATLCGESGTYTCAKLGCNIKFNATAFCQCSRSCRRHGNCCTDYRAACR